MINPFSLASWGATDDEIVGSMVGDDQVPDAMFSATRSISILAPPASVFPWLRQMGFRRAGWYSYDWIDNFGKESARHIHPEWQHLESGGLVPAGPISFIACTVDPDRAFCLVQASRFVAFSLAFELRPEADGTRLVSRARANLCFPGGATTAEEAVLELELVNHDFYFFHNSETMRAAIVYRREDGDFGLIDEAG